MDIIRKHYGTIELDYDDPDEYIIIDTVDGNTQVTKENFEN